MREKNKIRKEEQEKTKQIKWMQKEKKKSL